MKSSSLKKCLTGVLPIILILISDNTIEADVHFKSHPTTAKVYESDSVLLPCYSTERHTRVRWFDDDNNVIADSQLPQLQEQYDRVLHSNGSLEVINVQLNDTGNYICEVTIGYKVFKQVNAIEVQVPPEVITYPAGFMNITLGGIFQITCEAKGVPYPIISWRHNNQKVTNTDDSNRRLTVEVKHYDMAGNIECVADNGVGEPASNGLVLLVQFAPEVIVKNPIVHTKVGLQGKIECIVFSHPTAQIHWFFEGKPVVKMNNLFSAYENDLTVTEALPSYYSKKRHVLTIRSVREADLGKYECKADNALGLSSGTVTLMANPLKPIFEDKNQPATPTTKVLSWQTQSLSPIIDYSFKFRLVKTGNENFQPKAKNYWTTLTIPADKDTTGPFHTKSYKLEGLGPSRVYEVSIQARNQYGQSEQSNILQFSTPAVSDIISSSSSTESNEYDSRFDDDQENEIYPAPFNAGSYSTTIATMSFTVFIIFCRIFL
ncbi:unnamed protein product [Chironomus riparius]|uniref:Uncharacterized protein n=1 Tax=Chironomus riparius TaxID=315576 RepID=A0A9N9RXN8_9DIPT|nr:unnamed protein product [Chironomus riparius]